MRKLVALAALALAAAGCGKDDDSLCKRYARMEVKCGDIPDDEKQLTLQMAEGFCVGSRSGPDQDNLMAKSIRAESECAKTAGDSCSAYEACTEAARNRAFD